MSFYVFLFLVESSAVFSAFVCSPVHLFSKLIEYDEAHGTEFIHTLYTLLKNNMSPSVAANELHVHRSTVLYRMEKIVSITGLDLDDFETKLYLAIFIKMRKKAGLTNH